MSAPDYTTLLKQVGIDINKLTARERTQITNAMSAAYNQGYVVGYGAAISNM